MIRAAINFPRICRYKKISALSVLYILKLGDEMTPLDHAILGHSAFVNNTSCRNWKISHERKTNETSDISQSKELAAIDLIRQIIMPSEIKKC